MNYTQKCYINFIAVAINEKKGKDINFDSIDLNELIALSSNQKNPAMVYVGLKYYDVPKKMNDVFLSGLHVSSLAYSKRFSVMNMVTELFEKKQIRHIIVKGTTIAKYYPAPELRTMDDVDFVINFCDKEKAEKTLIENGAIQDAEGSDKYNSSWKYKGQNIELHYRLGYHAHFNFEYDYEKFFEDIWENIDKIENETYELNFSYSFIYNIFHLAKHFYKSGCGVRMITDISLMIKNAEEKTNWNAIFEKLDSIGLKGFAICILRICREWFGIKLPDIGIAWEKVECPVKIQDYILHAGVFGFSNVSEDISSIRTSSEHGYTRGFLKWAFPSYRHMKTYSPWFQNKPAILLPVAYIERMLRNAKERGGMVRWIKALRKGKNSNDYHNEILEMMELR